MAVSTGIPTSGCDCLGNSSCPAHSRSLRSDLACDKLDVGLVGVDGWRPPIASEKEVRMDRRDVPARFVVTRLLAVLCGLGASAGAAKADRPNVIVIIS